MATIEGNLSAPKNARFGVVVSRFNHRITDTLLAGCLDTLKRNGLPEDAVDVVWVPGAMEIPVVAKRMAEGDNYAAVICLGCVIRGATPHFDHVAAGAAHGISAAAYDTGKPVIFGVLTTDTIEQAVERAGTKAGNKGADAAMAALEMVDLLSKL